MKTFLIAEAGSCHDGEFAKAMHLVALAKTAGASAVKFQYWSDPQHLAYRRHAPEYEDVYRRYQVPAEWLPTLRGICDRLDLEFMCTAYLPEDILRVAPFVSRFKVAAFEAGDAAFIAAHANVGKPVFVSAGMMGALPEHLRTRPAHVQLLHCVSSYPVQLSALNLAVFRTGEYVGLSDHTGVIETGLYAVLAGAQVLEVHIKLDETDSSNPDAGAHALGPHAFRFYVEDVRRAEVMLGDGVRRVDPSETAMARYRVVA